MTAFIRKHNLHMSVKRIATRDNPNDWPADSFHFMLSITQGRLHPSNPTMHVTYSMGPGTDGKPKLADVLECIALDVSGFENSSNFEDWCSEYGYDTDSRKAERIYRSVSEQRDRLCLLLNAGAVEELLYQTENN